MMKPAPNDFFDELGRKWPSAIVARERLSDFTGGLMSSKYMANLDCRGEGPPRIKIGHKVAYPTNSLIDWLRERAEQNS